MFEKVTSTKSILLLILVALTATHIQAQTNNWRICNSQPDGTIFPINGTCNSYVYCIGGKPFSLPCPPFMGFSTTVLACVIYSNSDCVDQTTTTNAPIYSSKEDPILTTLTTTLVTKGYCDNEQSLENQKACLGHYFGDLVPYPGSCAKFLVCICDYPVVSICPSGMWFDRKLKICNSPSNVECDDKQGVPSEEATTPNTLTTNQSNDWGKDCIVPEGISGDICLNYDNGVLLKDPYNCSDYINCYMGCPIMSYCADNKVFNNLLKKCDAIETAQCEELPMPSTTTTSTEESITTTHKSISTTIEPSISTEIPTTTNKEFTFATEETSTSFTSISTPSDDCIPPLGIYADICANQPQDYYISYPYNCTAFIICIWECPYLEYCENNKIFNNILSICDTPESIQCKELSHPTPGTPTSTLSTVNTGPTTSTTTELPFSTTLPPDVNPDLCWNQPNYTTYPYAADCSKYLQCLNNKIRVHSCPNGWLFNSQLMLCDKTSEDFCLMGSTTTEKTLIKAATPKADNFDLCIGQLSGTTFPDTRNCSIYYLCIGNDLYHKLPCPINNYYDTQTGNCRPVELVSPTACQIDITTPEPTTTIKTVVTAEPDSPSQGICGNFSNGALIEYPDNCQKYISCVRPIPIAFYCNNNWNFDEEQQKCIPDSQGICSKLPSHTTTTIKPPTNICEGLAEGDWQLYPSDCQFYYECLGDGYFMLKMCMKDKYFDPLIGQCSSQVNEEYCMKNFDSTTTTQASSTPKPMGICDEQPLDSKIPYPDNCFKYIVCDTPIPVGFNCPLDLQFSLEQQNCVEPIDSDCGIITTPTTTTFGPPTIPHNQCTNKPEFTLLPYPKDCGMFIICIQDLEHLAFCYKNQYFDALRGACVDEANKDACRVAETTTTIEDLSTTKTKEDLTTTSEYLTTTTEVLTTISEYLTTIEISTTEITTSIDYSTQDSTFLEESTTTTTTTLDPNLGPCYGKPEGTKIPYPNNCTKYIECLDSLPVCYECPVGLEFSVDIGECVLPELADCSIKTTTTEINTKTTTTPIITPETTTENIYTETSTTTSPNYEDVCENKPNCSTLPYPEDCSKYYTCIDGKPKLTNCMLNTYYDPISGGCYDDISPTACQEPKTTTTPNSEETCENKHNGSTLTYPADCSKYYNCLNGYPILTKCMLNTYYDPSSGECCGDISPTACQGITTPTTLSTPEATTISQTTKYIRTETTSTPETSTTANVSTETSEATITPTTPNTTPEITTNPDSEKTCENKHNGSTLPYPSDCSKYYTCINGKSKLTNCMTYAYFDPSSGMCDSDISPTACLEISTTIPTTKAATISQTTETTIISETPLTTTENVSTETTITPTTPTALPEITTTPDIEETCEHRPNGSTSPYPADCSKYYTCINGNLELTNCMTNSYYDPYIGVCEHDISPTACKTITTTTVPTEATRTSQTTDTTITSETPITSTEYISTETTITTTTTNTTITVKPTTTTEAMTKATIITEATTLTTLDPTTTTTPDVTTLLTTTENVSTETTITPTTPTALPEITTTPDIGESCEHRPNGSTSPYPADCSKYYTCINGNLELTNCMTNSYYDPYIGVCEHDISPTACKTITTTTVPTEATRTSQTTDTTSTSETPITTTEYISTETTITTTTTNTTITVKPTTTTETMTKATIITEATTLTTLDPTTTTTPDVTTLDPTTSTSKPQYEDICRGHLNGTRLPYPGDNSKYILCQYPVPLEKQCPYNSQFDVNTKTCQTVSESITYAPPDCFLYNSGHVIVYEGDCSKYYLCFGNDAVVLNCTEGWYFSASLKQCIPKAYYSCPW